MTVVSLSVFGCFNDSCCFVIEFEVRTDAVIESSGSKGCGDVSSGFIVYSLASSHVSSVLSVGALRAILMLSDVFLVTYSKQMLTCSTNVTRQSVTDVLCSGSVFCV